MKNNQWICLALSLALSTQLAAQDSPLRIAVISLTHGHVNWVFDSEARGDIEIIGIVEPDRNLAARYAAQHEFPMDKVYECSEALLAEAGAKIEAVTAFGNIYDHLQVVETFAPRGIHVMVEKPLATTFAQAKKMAALAEKNDIHLLTNYETTWYPTNHLAYELIEEGKIGEIRKVVVRDGHRGPKKIGVSKEFFEWLTDPKLNGGGAIIDFGCYGANLLTWLMQGERPNSVTAVTRQLQAENNSKVDDEAIIILNYDDAVAIIQASWNWPIGRKDMEIYGLTGVVYADNRHDLRVRMAKGYDGFDEEKMTLEERPAPYNDPFLYLTAVIREEINPAPYDLSSLENNLLAMEILTAAVKSAQNGNTVHLK